MAITLTRCQTKAGSYARLYSRTECGCGTTLLAFGRLVEKQRGGKHSLFKVVTRVRPLARQYLTLGVLIIGLASGESRAACRYPVPDGAESRPSAANLVGTVVAIGRHRIDLKTRAGLVRRIRPPHSDRYYTAFGGDDRIAKLKTGSVARAWFLGCKEPKAGVTPEVVYLEVYSNDPKDHPSPEYWKE